MEHDIEKLQNGSNILYESTSHLHHNIFKKIIVNSFFDFLKSMGFGLIPFFRFTAHISGKLHKTRRYTFKKTKTKRNHQKRKPCIEPRALRYVVKGGKNLLTCLSLYISLG
jgi:hypothetical protein